MSQRDDFLSMGPVTPCKRCRKPTLRRSGYCVDCLTTVSALVLELEIVQLQEVVSDLIAAASSRKV